MSSASRRFFITSCKVSLSLPTTRSWSPWILTCTFGVTFCMLFRRSRAISSVMPALRCTSICPRPLPTVFGSSALNSFGDSGRRAAFSRKTCRAAFARSSLAESMRISWSWRSNVVCVSLKSYRVLTSRRAWSIALVSSAGSNSETTSKENSATRMHDRVDARVHRRGGEEDPDERGEDEDRPDPRRAFVQRLHRGLVVRVRPIVEVVDVLGTSALHELIEHRLAAGRQLLPGEVGDGLPQVVAGSPELGDDHVERLGRGRRRVLPAQVRDDPIEAHIGDSFRCRGRCADQRRGAGDSAREWAPKIRRGPRRPRLALTLSSR